MTREEFRGALSDIDEGGRLSHSEEARKAEILLLDHDKEQRAEISQAHKTNEYLASQIRTWEKICSEERAEVARLREALQEIADYDAGVAEYPGSCCSGCDSPGIAKTALKEAI